jgi:hypothetical protein
MAVTDTVEIEFLAKDEVSKILQNIDKNVDKMANSVRKGGKETEKSFIDMNRVVESTLGFSFGNIMTKAIDSFGQFTQESIKNAIKFERQLQALNVQTGQTADTLLNEMNVATEGLVDDLSLAAGASKALALGLKQESLPQLAKTAVALGKMQGLRPEQAFNDLVTGIGRASPMILDNLGIVLDSEAAYKAWAKANDRTVESLSKLEKTTILTNTVLENANALVLAMGIQAETTADKLDKARASATNFGLAVVGHVVNGITQLIELNSQEYIASLSSEYQAAADSAGFYADQVIRLTKEQTDLNTSLKASQDALMSLLQGGLTEEQEQKQTQLNKLKLEELRIQKDLQGVSGAATISGSSFEIHDKDKYNTMIEKQKEMKKNLDEQKAIQLELNILAADQKVKLDEREQTLEDTGKILKDTIAANNTEILSNIEKEVENYDTIKASLSETNLRLIENGEAMKTNREEQDKIVEGVRKEYEYRKLMLALGDFTGFGLQGRLGLGIAGSIVGNRNSISDEVG